MMFICILATYVIGIPISFPFLRRSMGSDTVEWQHAQPTTMSRINDWQTAFVVSVMWPVFMPIHIHHRMTDRYV